MINPRRMSRQKFMLATLPNMGSEFLTALNSRNLKPRDELSGMRRIAWSDSHASSNSEFLLIIERRWNDDRTKELVRIVQDTEVAMPQYIYLQKAIDYLGYSQTVIRIILESI